MFNAISPSINHHLLLLILNNEVAHGTAAIQPLLEVQSNGGAAYFDEVSGARYGGLGAAGAGDHYV